MRLLVALKALLFVVLLPGVVAVYVPWHIMHASHSFGVPPRNVSTIAAALVVAIGAVVLLRCVWDFLAAGHGTLAPVDPPRRLVVRGLYRYTRNPMYNGVLAMILGQAWLFRSPALVAYALGVFAINHLFVVLYEERTLASRFGDAYLAYRRAVPRWGFTRRPYRHVDPGA